MSKKTVHTDIATVEFLLDLPEGTSIIGGSVVGGELVLELETPLTIPDDSKLVYETDDYGNIALVGIE